MTQDMYCVYYHTDKKNFIYVLLRLHSYVCPDHWEHMHTLVVLADLVFVCLSGKTFCSWLRTWEHGKSEMDWRKLVLTSFDVLSVKNPQGKNACFNKAFNPGHVVRPSNPMQQIVACSSEKRVPSPSIIACSSHWVSNWIFPWGGRCRCMQRVHLHIS